MSLNKVDGLVAIQVLCLRQSEYVVELSNELLDSGDELDDTFRNHNSTEVVTLSSTSCNSVSDVCYDVIKTLSLSLNLLRNKTDVGLCLQGTLQSDMRC